MKKGLLQTGILLAALCMFLVWASKTEKGTAGFMEKKAEMVNGVVWRITSGETLELPSVLYEVSSDRLDSLLDKQGKREAAAKNYEEIIWSDYQFGQTYGGKMSVLYQDNEPFSFIMEVGETENVIKTSQKYEYRRLEDGSLWFCVWDSEDRKVDLPDYLVNEAVLKYYVPQETEEEEGESTSWEGKKREFWLTRGELYEVDYLDHRLILLTDEREILIANFLQEQEKRLSYAVLVDEYAWEAVEELIPTGYSPLGGREDLAVSDLNQDGKMDYVLALYPNDYSKEKRYDGFSPYEKTPEYYAAEFWLIQSGPKGYEPIRLTDTVEYMGDALTLLEIDFVEDGILQLYYFVGRSPWTTAMHQFQYNGQDGFDFYRSVYREMTDSMLVNDRETLGQMSMYDFFHGMYTRIPVSKRGDMNFAIDQETGNRIEVTEILDMDEFLEIVEEWAKEEGMTYLKKKKLEHCIRLCWEKPGAYGYYHSEKGVMLSLQLWEKGLTIQADYGENQEVGGLIDMEYFFHTGLWQYMQPDYDGI
ncbi:MAG: hypothetical protein IJP31_07145 [Lachnospiraceae bacterium]|nr:hypothetical protein [Lachnospiraceae bacterium]